MEGYRKRLQEESTCCICLEYFTDPVTLNCGHNFCHVCITNYSPRVSTCPQCREMVHAKKFKPNKQLANVVEITKELKYGVLSVEEAVQEWKDQINNSLGILRKERENILQNKDKKEEGRQDMLKQIQAERVKTRAAFRKQHQFLEEQEKLLLAQMDEVEKTVNSKDENLSRLTGEVPSLDSLIQELEEKQQQSGNEFLQNIENVLVRCPKEPKESSENPMAFLVAQKWKLQDFSDINPFLDSLMKEFQDSLRDGLQLKKATVTLDPDTAHPKLILSEDCKSVRWKDKKQFLPKNPKRFSDWAFVLGREEFSSGRHFWEVSVGNEEAWAVGVARASVRRNGKFDVCPEEGIWDLGNYRISWDDDYRISNPFNYSSLHRPQKLKRIRVTLNCAGGRVAFFDADTGELLSVYSDASLCGKTLVPFFYAEHDGHLALCP